MHVEPSTRRPATAHRFASLLALLVLSVGWILATGPAAAQQAGDDPALEVLDVQHDPSGSLTIQLRAGGSREVEIRSLTAFVNDIPVTLDVVGRPEPEALAVALVIDTSGSMQGAWMEAARDAAHQLVGRLPDDDRVAILSFATTPIVHAPLTPDRTAVAGAIDSLQAGGWTALYDAVVAGIAALDDAAEPRRAIVLLADGEDNISETSAAESLQRTADAGVTVYTVGIGRLFDPTYLEDLAAATDGRFVGLVDEHDDGALAAVFTQIGGELGSRDTYQIPVRPLALGEHTLRLRAVVNGDTVTAEASFTVSNSGLMRATVEEPPQEGDPITIRLDTLVPAADLAIEALANGTTLPASGDTIALDPWHLPSGDQAIEVVAYVRGEVAARQTVTVRVPVLSPRLIVSENDDGYGAAGRVQGVDAPAIVVLAGDAEIARGAGEVVLPPTGDALTVQLLDGNGTVVASEEVAAAGIVAGSGGSSPVALTLILSVAAAAGTWAWRRRRARSSPPPAGSVERVAPRRRLVASVGSQPDRELRVGTVVVRNGDGVEHYTALTRRPLSVGRDPACDVVLRDPAIRPRHATVTALPGGEVRVHALADRGTRPYEPGERVEDEWVVLHDGEQVALGSHVLQIRLGADD